MAAKAVDMLAARSIFDGFVYEDDVENGIEDVLRLNRFKIMYKQATKSELVHSCAFATVSKGAEGEPPVLVSFYSAVNGAVIWDSRLKREECGFTIVKIDEKTNMPTWIDLYTDDAVIELREEGVWRATRLGHPQGRPLIYALVHCPDLDRPLGKSRISRAVMSLADSAIRTALRSEVSAEFFTSPQKYLLGIQEGFFDDNPKWDAYIGNILAVTENPETGTVPQFGQLPQGTMQPHIDYMRSLAASFSGETNIPINALGIIHDNPASAEAMRTAESYLIMDAEDLNEVNGDALRNIGLMIHAIQGNTTVDKLTDAEKSIEPRFRNPSMPSVVSQSDAIIKQVSAIPWLAETEVALEELGYNKEQRTRLLSDKRKIAARAALEQARQQAAERLANGEEARSERCTWCSRSSATTDEAPSTGTTRCSSSPRSA